jgi:hypothetical protein
VRKLAKDSVQESVAQGSGGREGQVNLAPPNPLAGAYHAGEGKWGSRHQRRG